VKTLLFCLVLVLAVSGSGPRAADIEGRFGLMDSEDWQKTSVLFSLIAVGGPWNVVTQFQTPIASQNVKPRPIDRTPVVAFVEARWQAPKRRWGVWVKVLNEDTGAKDYTSYGGGLSLQLMRP
jgi:hypothetical protein